MGKVYNTTGENLKRYSARQIQLIKEAVADTASDIEAEATRNAPNGEDGDIFIDIDKRFSNKGLTAEVGVMGENNMAAYFEFGTGLSAREILQPYPQWVKDIAMKFYINGKGTLQGKPYLYPAVFKNTKKFEIELKRIQEIKTGDG